MLIKLQALKKAAYRNPHGIFAQRVSVLMAGAWLACGLSLAQLPPHELLPPAPPPPAPPPLPAPLLPPPAPLLPPAPLPPPPPERPKLSVPLSPEDFARWLASEGRRSPEKYDIPAAIMAAMNKLAAIESTINNITTGPVIPEVRELELMERALPAYEAGQKEAQQALPRLTAIRDARLRELKIIESDPSLSFEMRIPAAAGLRRDIWSLNNTLADTSYLIANYPGIIAKLKQDIAQQKIKASEAQAKFDDLRVQAGTIALELERARVTEKEKRDRAEIELALSKLPPMPEPAPPEPRKSEYTEFIVIDDGSSSIPDPASPGSGMRKKPGKQAPDPSAPDALAQDLPSPADKPSAELAPKDTALLAEEPPPVSAAELSQRLAPTDESGLVTGTARLAHPLDGMTGLELAQRQAELEQQQAFAEVRFWDNSIKVAEAAATAGKASQVLLGFVPGMDAVTIPLGAARGFAEAFGQAHASGQSIEDAVKKGVAVAGINAAVSVLGSRLVGGATDQMASKFLMVTESQAAFLTVDQIARAGANGIVYLVVKPTQIAAEEATSNLASDAAVKLLNQPKGKDGGGSPVIAPKPEPARGGVLRPEVQY